MLIHKYLTELARLKRVSGSTTESIVREAFKTPKDPTIREKFNTYRFADYKDKVTDLLARVTTVSVETTKIVAAMRQANR